MALHPHLARAGQEGQDVAVEQIITTANTVQALDMLLRSDEAALTQAIREFAADLVAGLCRRLMDGGVPGLHFYTLNLARPTEAVLTRL